MNEDTTKSSAPDKLDGGKKTEDKKRKKFSFSAWFEKESGRPLRKSDKILFGVLLVIFLFVFYVVLDANKYPALLQVVEGEGKVGVNPTDQALDFGDLSRGTSAVRRVEIVNGTWSPMYIAIFKTGSIRELVDIDRNHFKIAPNTDMKVEFAAYIPASAETSKYYTGRVYVFKIPTFGL